MRKIRKKTLFALLITGLYSMAMAEPSSQPSKVKSAPVDENTSTIQSIEQLKQGWLKEQQDRLQQRSNYLQLESLLDKVRSKADWSPAIQTIIQQLSASLAGYPLKEDIAWRMLKAKINAEQVSETEIAQFIAQYPNSAKRNNLNQLPYRTLYEQQKYADLIAYSEKVPPTSVENQCRLFASQYQLLAEQIQSNPEAEQAGNSAPTLSADMQKLLDKFDLFWRDVEHHPDSFWLKINDAPQNFWSANEYLPSECDGLKSYWQDQQYNTAEKVKEKAVNLFNLEAKRGLDGLAANAEGELKEWFAAVLSLVADPREISTFVKKQPVDEWNKAIVIKTFPAFMRTFKEDTANPNFAPYQEWATQWQLSAEALKGWKISFINRFFDNTDSAFQAWRDEQLKQLQADNLTERRLRMAIWQQTDLKPWLALLSAEAKEKAEWRYWQAKTDASQRDAILTKLSTERGFYPMLAAKMLNRPYQVSIPAVTSLNAQQQAKFQSELDRIAELRELKRFGFAKVVWIDLVKSLSFEEQIALAHYAQQQNWFDLTVEATIQAKAWDYIDLRLPNAYSDWFEMNLAGSPIRKSFAMAIARQESAWNFEARSHANALGLMQMLASTASQTAKNNQLPYDSERDLLDPFKNIMLGTAHLAELDQKYPRNRILIASAYNAGVSRVERWLARANGRLAMDEFVASIPFLETRGYVQNVLAYDYYYQTLYGKGEKVMFNPEEIRKY